ncbi:MAG TPA: A24 family peptidase [Rhodoglobus sp.]|nr:A24 family peptidase [Rhodoglobus sp.]
MTTRWWRLPAASVLAAIALVAVGPDPRALPLVYLAAVTPTLCAIDALERRLPNSLVLPGYLAASAGIVAHWIVGGESSTVAVVSGVLYFVVMLAFAVAGGMGMGDVKLAGVLGLSAGLVSATAAVVSPLVAFVLGGIAAIGALRGGRGASIPFGPFLLAGFWVAVVVG